MRTLAPALVATLLLTASADAWAIYQCRDAKGTVVFQDHPCAETQKAEREIDAHAGAPKGESTPVRVAVPPVGDVVVRVPAGWGRQVQDGGEMQTAAMVLKTYGAGGRAELALTLSPDPSGKLASDQLLAEEVTRASQPHLAGSVQGKIELSRMSSSSGNGAYASFSAREHRPIPAFAHVTVGAFSTKGIFCTFTLSSDNLASENQKSGLAIVSRGITLAPKK